ncbi:hypothetical protein [Spiroplasma sp. TIUS-1]|uniref:hypothetical protein n=1 Tax=Spiroplasma sp. TIUS-1 TaxID=216963 RepID=UPI0013A68C12|nr:hypothetical protein [Spiroplasma sp. TIUS-1]
MLSYSLLLNVLDKNQSYPFLNIISSLSTSNQSALTIVAGFCIFSLFYIWDIKYSKFLNYLGSLSIIVYAAHYTILYWYKDQFVSNWNMSNGLEDFIVFALTLITSIFISILVSPILKIYQKNIKKIYTKILIKIKIRLSKKGI